MYRVLHVRDPGRDRAARYALTPGRYVGATDVEDDDEEFEVQMAKLTGELSTLFGRGKDLEAESKSQLGEGRL